MKIEEYAAKAMQAMMTVSLERCLEDPEAMAKACFEVGSAMADEEKIRNAGQKSYDDKSPREDRLPESATQADHMASMAKATGKRYTLKDPTVPGLMLRVGNSGHKTWVIRITIKDENDKWKNTLQTIGPFRDIDSEAARKRAQEIRGLS